MMSRRVILAASLATFIGSAILAVAQDKKVAPTPSADHLTQPQQTVAARNDSNTEPSLSDHSAATARAATHTSILDARAVRLEGEKRFRAHCGRCHVAPQKFPPREMATIIRHMRVRAMLTQDDMKFILEYMTQ